MKRGFLVLMVFSLLSQGLFAEEEATEPVEESKEPVKEQVAPQTEKKVWGVGAQVGYGETHVSDSTQNSRHTVTVGGVIDYLISDQWSLQSELNYFKKGYKTPGGFLNDQVVLNYLEVPIFLKARSTWTYFSPQVFLGPSLAYLHSAEKTIGGVELDTTSTSNRFELGFYVGLGLDLLLSDKMELTFSGRYGWGLTDIQDLSFGPGLYNRAFHLVAGLKFRL